METIFDYDPSEQILEEIGVPESTKEDYLKRIKKERSEKEVLERVLYDLEFYFSILGNETERLRIEKRMEEIGAFDVELPDGAGWE